MNAFMMMYAQGSIIISLSSRANSFEEEAFFRNFFCEKSFFVSFFTMRSKMMTATNAAAEPAITTVVILCTPMPPTKRGL